MARKSDEDSREFRRERPAQAEAQVSKQPRPQQPNEPVATPRTKPQSVKPRGPGPGQDTKQPEAQVVPPAPAGPKPGNPPRDLPPPPPARADAMPGTEGERGGQRKTQGDIQRPATPGGPIPESVQDGTGKPITAPSTTKAVGVPAPGQPRPEPVRDRSPSEAASVPGQMQVLNPDGTTSPAPPTTDPASSLAQSLPGESPPLNASGLPQTVQEQHALLKQGIQSEIGDTSGFLSSGAAAKEIEHMRMSQPSPIKGIPTGTYEKVVKANYEQDFPGRSTPLTERQNRAFNVNAAQQLEKFGEYPGKGDPDAPAPPIRPGGRSFNPFSGSFTGEEGPNAFKLMGIDLDSLKKEFYTTGGGGQPAPTLGPPPPPTKLM